MEPNKLDKNRHRIVLRTLKLMKCKKHAGYRILCGSIRNGRNDYNGVERLFAKAKYSNRWQA